MIWLFIFDTEPKRYNFRQAILFITKLKLFKRINIVSNKRMIFFNKRPRMRELKYLIRNIKEPD